MEVFNVFKQMGKIVKNALLPGMKLTPQEEVVKNIVEKILNAPGTIKLTPVGGEYYLINHSIHYYIRIQGNRLSIINTVDSIIRDCSANFELAIKNMIDESVNSDLEKINNTLFNGEMKLLEKLKSNTALGE